jgi:Nif-specific regulatory protein
MAQLVVKRGPHVGTTHALDGDVVSVGRESSNDVCLRHETVSRNHARLLHEASGWAISDLRSSNGTYLNGRRVEREAIRHMDEVCFGDVAVLFMDDDPALLDAEDEPPEITQVLDSSTIEILRASEQPPATGEAAAANRGLVQLFRLSNEVGACRTLPELMDRLTGAASEALHADRVVPITVEGKDELRPWYGRNTGRSPALAELPISTSVVRHVRKTGEAVLSEVASDDRFRASRSIVKNQIQTAICVPLKARGSELGVIYADRVAPAEPFDRTELEMLAAMAMPVVVAIENIRCAQDLQGERERLVDQMKLEHSLIGEHASIRGVLDLIERVAPTDTSVLVIGDSGTGKELVARALHLNSRRNGQAFEAVNCAALAPTLLESELFGHVKGAFTGAIDDKPGRFELAHEGTLFLDEIGELPLDSQAKLLRVIEQGELRRVGDTRDRHVDVRILAATNKQLQQMITEKTFREDLFYRLNIVRIEMPPLRSRGSDVDLLIDHFLGFFCDKVGRRPLRLSARTRELLCKYSWPGNVRELKNLMERLVVVVRGEEVKPDDLPPEVCAGVAQPGGVADPTASLADLEREHIIRVLGHTGGNKKESAGILGIDRSTLYSKLKQYGIE